MWRFVGVLCFLLLPCAIDATPPIRACPPNKVCVNFVEDACRKDVNEDYGNRKYIARTWTENYNNLCYYHDEKGIYALLDIEVLTPFEWSFYVAIYKLPNVLRTKYEDRMLKFVFAWSELTFDSADDYADVVTAKFTWNIHGIYKSTTSPAKKLGVMDASSSYQYTFTVSAEGERLAQLIGDTVAFVNPYYLDEDMKLDDSWLPRPDRFGHKLATKSTCFVSGLQRVCIGGPCDTMPERKYVMLNREGDAAKWKSTESIAQFCPTKLWFHDKTVDKDNKLWKDADRQLMCHENIGRSELGSWYIWNLPIDENKHEFQCSATKPGEPALTSEAPTELTTDAIDAKDAAETTESAATIESGTMESAASETTEAAATASAAPAAASVGVIAGGVVGGLLLLIVVAVGAFFCGNRHKRNRELRGSSSLSKTSSKAQTPGTEMERVKMELRQHSPASPSPAGTTIEPEPAYENHVPAASAAKA